MKTYRIHQFGDLIREAEPLYKGGPYIGPKGGKWADPQHTIPWKKPSLRWEKLPSNSDKPFETVGYRAETPRGTATIRKQKKGRSFTWVLSVGSKEVELGRRADFDHAEGALQHLYKASPPSGGGWRPVGRKGGYVRTRGAKREYWYPTTVQKPPRRRPKVRKPQKRPQTTQGPPKLPEGRYKSMKAIESSAPMGSAKWRMETGHYQLIRKRVFTRDQDEMQRRKTAWAPNVDDQTKLELIRDYQPLVKSLAKKLSRQFHLPFTQTVLQDMQSAGVEGLLVAIDKYKGGTAFDPSLVVRDMMRLHASREFLGFELPELHARNLARYIAARHQASKKLGKTDPTPEEVVPFFDLRKRHVHSGLPAYDESRKIGEHPKTIMKEFELPNGRVVEKEVRNPKAGEPIYAPLRNEQIPNFDGYTLPEHLGRKGSDEEASDRKRKQQPSKLEWAQMYDSFLKGQKGMQVFEAEVIAPGAGVGYGFSVEDQIVIRHDLQDAAMKISAMGASEMAMKSYPGAKKPTTYRVRDLGDIVMRRLGVDQEEHSVKALVRSVPIEKKTKSGWKRVGDRQAETVMQAFVEKGMQQLPKHTVGSHAKRVAQRAQQAIAPTKRAPLGPSYIDVVKREAARLSSSEVERFRRNYRGPNADHVQRMSPQELRVVIAERSQRARGLAAEIRRAMTAHMTIERVDPMYGIARRLDPETGRMESVRVRMNYERNFKKSMADLPNQVLRDIYYHPNLMKLLTSDGPPSRARGTFQRMVGLL